MVNQVLVRLWMRLDACLTGGVMRCQHRGKHSGALCVLSSKSAMRERSVPKLGGDGSCAWWVLDRPSS
jgi:hypothetical protein